MGNIISVSASVYGVRDFVQWAGKAESRLPHISGTGLVKLWVCFIRGAVKLCVYLYRKLNKH